MLWKVWSVIALKLRENLWDCTTPTCEHLMVPIHVPQDITHASHKLYTNCIDFIPLPYEVLFLTELKYTIVEVFLWFLPGKGLGTPFLEAALSMTLKASLVGVMLLVLSVFSVSKTTITFRYLPNWVMMGESGRIGLTQSLRLSLAPPTYTSVICIILNTGNLDF